MGSANYTSPEVDRALHVLEAHTAGLQKEIDGDLDPDARLSWTLGLNDAEAIAKLIREAHLPTVDQVDQPDPIVWGTEGCHGRVINVVGDGWDLDHYGDSHTGTNALVHDSGKIVPLTPGMRILPKANGEPFIILPPTT